MTEANTRPQRSQSGWLAGLLALIVVLLLIGGSAWVGWRYYRAWQMIQMLEQERVLLEAREARDRRAAEEARAQVAELQDPPGDGALEKSPSAAELP